MIKSINNFEYKNVSIDGLDTTKHTTKLNELREKGWFVFRSSPDAHSGHFLYQLKRTYTPLSKRELNM